MTARDSYSPRFGTEWAGVARDERTGRTIRRNENGAWISNDEWLRLYGLAH